MPAGYVIAQLRVTNPENYKEYIEENMTTVTPSYTQSLVCCSTWVRLEFNARFMQAISVILHTYLYILTTTTLLQHST